MTARSPATQASIKRHIEAARPASYLSRSALAAELDIGETTVDEMVRRGVLPKPFESDGGPHWSWEEVDARLHNIKPQGTVYFIGFGDYVKIGFTTGQLEFRLAAIQTGAPERLEVYATVSGSMEDERRYHKKFAHVRLNGEWFRRCPDLTDTIKAIATGDK